MADEEKPFQMRPVSDADDERHEEAARRPTPFPGTVMAAGIIWIIMGAIIAVSVVMILLAAPKVAEIAAQKGQPLPKEGLQGILAGTALCIGLFAIAFLFVGYQTVTGSAKDTMGNAIGSIVFALLNAAGNNSMSFLYAGALLTAGILAIVGRGDYKDWRKRNRAA